MKLWHLTISVSLLMGFLANAVPRNSTSRASSFPLTFAYSVIDTQIVSDKIVYLKGCFPFVNEADTPVVIRNVKAAYGGMTTTYNKQPILPRQRDTIWYQMRFWKDFRGPFSKAITVCLDGASTLTSTTQILFVKGKVTGPHDAKLVFLQREANLDTLPVGTVRKLKFPFINQGTGPLIIESVKVSCNILNPSWQNDIFEPGDTGWVFATFHVNTTGRFRKTITVYSNDPRNRTTQLMVKAVGLKCNSPNKDAKHLNLFEKYGK